MSDKSSSRPTFGVVGALSLPEGMSVTAFDNIVTDGHPFVYHIDGPDGSGETGTARMEFGGFMLRDGYLQPFRQKKRLAKGWRRHVRQHKADQ